MKRFQSKLVSYFKNLTIRQKFLFIYFILIVIPLCLLTILSYVKTATIIENQVTNSAMQVLEQTSSFLSYKMKNVIEISDTVFMNQEIQEVLTRDMASYTIIQQIDDYKKAGKFITDLQDSRDIYRIRLYVRDGLIYSNEKINFYNLNSIYGTDWYNKMAAYNGRVCWIPTHSFTYLRQGSKNIISASRLIRNYKNTNEVIGVVSIDILTDSIREILQKANLTKMGSIYLINEDGKVVTYSNEEPNQNVLGYIKEIISNGPVWEKADINGQQSIVAKRGLENTEWNLIAVIPLNEVLHPVYLLRNYMLVLMLIIGAIAYLLANYISDSSSRRIHYMIRTMKEVQTGKLDVKVPVDSKDEIGILQENFNYMIEKTNLLVDENYKMGKEVKNVELKALQAQINPHFLYNSLDLINWMAIMQKAQGISTMVNLLAKFYKLSLSKGKNTVSIADEIMHVKTYVQIQNKRFDDRIKFYINVDEEIYNYSILKIILQPLVENSILHGIQEKEDKTGTIEISGVFENDRIVLSVRDDGKGISEDYLRNLLNDDSIDEDHGYGIKNINNRLKLYYGEGCGLTYKSSPGKGTLVEVRIPAVRYS